MGFNFLDPAGLFSGPDASPNTANNNASMIAMAEASREASASQSNAQLQTSQIQAVTMQLGILQSSQQAQFQTLAWLTDRLDSNDTKLQIALENAKLHMSEQSNRHAEAMEALQIDARELDLRRSA